MTRNIWKSLFALYAMAMLYLLFGRKEAADTLPYWDQVFLRLQPVPFQTLGHQFRLLTYVQQPWLVRHAAVNLVGNVALFLPLGIFLPKLSFRLNRLWKVLAVTAGIMLLVEISQALTLLGRCDIDDLILNLLGSALGYWVYRWAFQHP